MRAKKLCALLLTTAMVTSVFTGCGKTSSTGDKASSADAGSSAKTETKDVKLTVWGPQEDQAKMKGYKDGILKAMCDSFNEEHPEWNITFEYGVCSEGDAKDVVTKDVDSAADVYMYANDQIPTLVEAGALSKLGGTTVDEINENNEKAMIDSVIYDGSMYGIPYTSNTWFMYYDKSVFSDEDIKSFDTMLEKGKVAFPLSDSWYIQAFYVGNGCSLFGDGTDAAAGIDFDGEKAAAVTDYLVDVVANPNFINDADGAGLAGLRDGSVNAVFSGTWNAEAVKEALGDNMGVAALPSFNLNGTDCQMKSFIGSKAIGVNPNAENMQVAMALAAYLAGEDAQKDHYDMRNILPTNTNVAVDDEIAAAVADVMINTSIMQPLVPEMGNYWSPAENMGKALVAGEVTHDNAAEKTADMNTAMNTDAAQ